MKLKPAIGNSVYQLFIWHGRDCYIVHRNIISHSEVWKLLTHPKFRKCLNKLQSICMKEYCAANENHAFLESKRLTQLILKIYIFKGKGLRSSNW